MAGNTPIDDVPDAPTIGTATTVDYQSATITYTAAATGGAVTTFTVTSTPGSITATGSSPITVTGLSGSTSYTFKVKGTNTTATGPESAASNSITTSAAPVNTGFIFGGYKNTSPAAIQSSIQKLAYGTETRTSSSSTLSAATYGSAAMSNLNTAAYIATGQGTGSPAAITSIDKLVYASETRSTISATVPTAFYTGFELTNGTTAGYFGGGANDVVGGFLRDVYKLTYSSEARTTLANTLSRYSGSHQSMYNLTTAGYMAGGYGNTTSPTASSGLLTNIDKITYSSDAISTIGTTLDAGLNSGAGFSNGSTAGYMAGGNENVKVSTIRKLTFSSETRSTISATLSVAKTSQQGTSNTTTAGYIYGGSKVDEIYTDVIEKLTFSGETRSTIGATLATVLYFPGAASGNA